MTSAIETELCEATSVKQRKNEDTQKYLKRLVLGVNKLEDGDWTGLSNDAQNWANELTTAEKEGQTLPDFPDAEEEQPTEAAAAENGADSAAESGADGESGETAAPARVRRTTTAKAAKEPAPKKERVQSMSNTLKNFIIDDPSISVEDLIEKLKGAGHKPTEITVATIRSDFRNALKVLKGRGLLNIEL